MERLRRLTGGASTFDPSAVLWSMALDDARDLSDRVATVWSAEAVDGLDPQGLGELTRALAEQLPLVAPDRVSTLAAAVADSARGLAASRWRARGGERPETPVVDRSAVRAALLIHLHGRPDGPLSAALRRHHDEGRRFQGSGGLRRTPSPTREQVERFGRALRAHERELATYLASLEAD